MSNRFYKNVAWAFQSRLAGFLFFYWFSGEMPDERAWEFQSRLAGFLFFYKTTGC